MTMTTAEIAARWRGKEQTPTRERKAQKLAKRSGVPWDDVLTARQLHEVQQAIINAHVSVPPNVEG